MPGIDPAPPLPRPDRVPPCPLADLVALLRPDVTVVGDPAVAVTGCTHAGGEVRPGDLYVARPGGSHHGAAFAGQAVAAGAVAVLTDPAGADLLGAGAGPRGGTEASAPPVPVLVVPDPRDRMGDVAARVYGDPTAGLPVVGITGTAGKTTTAYLAQAGLRAAGRTPALLGTVETRLGDLVVDSARTTPEATDLHALLAVARERGCDTVVMEVSSHALALGRVGGVRFAVGAWTTFGQDHLDFHRDVDGYFAAKARLFDGRCRVEVLNHDEPALAGLRKPGTVTCSAAGAAGATWRAEEVGAADAAGFAQRFVAVGPAASPGAGPVRVPAGVGQPGRHSVANALVAIACLVEIGVPPEVAAAGVAAAPGVPGRMERVAGGDSGVLGVVDYAHKPDAVVAVLAALRPVAGARGGRVTCVIGAGGDRDRGKRAPMGAAAARGADLVVVTDDNPRAEDPAAIRAEVLAGARTIGGAEVVEVPGRREAIEQAARRAGAADVVVVLGKGHERGQEVAGRVNPFDDRTALAGSLAAAG